MSAPPPSLLSASARSFWESPTLDELAAAQGVRPMADVRALFGTWPGEADDGFEEAIDELRHPTARFDGRGKRSVSPPPSSSSLA